MVNLIYENGGFQIEKNNLSSQPLTLDVSLMVKDVVPNTEQSRLAQEACEFINTQLKANYLTDGVGDLASTACEPIQVIKEMTIRLYQK